MIVACCLHKPVAMKRPHQSIKNSKRCVAGLVLLLVLISSCSGVWLLHLLYFNDVREPQSPPSYVVCGSKCSKRGCKPIKCCPAGYALVDNTEMPECNFLWCNKPSHQKVCTPCPAGTFKTQAGIENKTCTPCNAGTYSTTTGATSAFSCIECAAGKRLATTGGRAESDCIKCAAGTYSSVSGLTSRKSCPSQCPPGSTSKAGSTLQLDCTCIKASYYLGPPGGPCELSREKMRPKGVIWLYGNDSFLEEMRFSASVYPWPLSLKDDDLIHHVGTWASEAARFWGDQGESHMLDSNMTSASLVVQDRRYKDAFWKDAAGLGAWIDTLRNSSIINPVRKKYGKIATAMDEWRLEDAARYFAQEGVGHDGQEVWPSTALISNALVWHDGIVVGQWCVFFLCQ